MGRNEHRRAQLGNVLWWFTLIAVVMLIIYLLNR